MPLTGHLSELKTIVDYKNLGTKDQDKLSAIMGKIEANFGVPLRIGATHPTPDSKLNIYSNQVESADGTKLILPPADGALDVFVDSTIDFLTGAITGGTILREGAVFSLPSGITPTEYIRMALVYRSGTNVVDVIFSSPNAALASLTSPALLFATLGGTSVSYVDLQAITSSTFKTALSATNIIENKVGANVRIFRIGAGSGSGSGSQESTEVTIANNQVAPADITGFLVNPSIKKGFTSDFVIKRKHTDGGLRSTTIYADNLGAGFDATVNAVAVQSDGKILAGGNFSNVGATAINKIVRLNSDGSIDTAFDTAIGTGFVGNVFSIAIQTDGKILVGGFFSDFDGTTLGNIARLNSDGTLDTAFDTAMGSGFNSTVKDIKVQTDGKILIGGQFGTLDSVTHNKLIRLNSNGTKDTTFNGNLGTGFVGNVNRITIQPNDQILVGGDFSAFAGNARVKLIRLDSDGTEDVGFYAVLNGGFNSSVYAIEVQADNKIVVGGYFTGFNTTHNYFVRLNSDGTVDTTFQSELGDNFNAGINSIVIQSDGRIVVSGFYTEFNTKTRNNIIRLNTDGTEDTLFYTVDKTGLNHVCRNMVMNGDKIILGGDFTSVNGTTRNNFEEIEGAAIQNWFDKVFNLRGYLREGVWHIGESTFIGDDPGINFNMTDAGQLEYSSSNLDGNLDESYLRYTLQEL